MKHALKFLLFFLLLITGKPQALEHNDMTKVKLLIKIPTRERFSDFFSTLDKYYNNLSYTIPYEFIISCDKDDPIMNSEKAKRKFKEYPNLKVYYCKNKSKIEACNNNIKEQNFDILLLASDDMIPIKKNFDLEIVTHMLQHFPNLDGIIQYDDGYNGEYLDTLPIMGINFYNKFGYVYHPSYKSLFCDAEMTSVARMLNKIVYIDEIIIKHFNPAIGNKKNDALYAKNNKFFSQDFKLFLTRQNNFFDLKKSEIINDIILFCK